MPELTKVDRRAPVELRAFDQALKENNDLLIILDEKVPNLEVGAIVRKGCKINICYALKLWYLSCIRHGYRMISDLPSAIHTPPPHIFSMASGYARIFSGVSLQSLR